MANSSILDINDLLDGYCDDIQELIAEETENIAKEGLERLKNNSPKRTGKYAKGWKIDKKKGYGYVNCIIHNKTNYQLTHLLEKPHASRNGGIVSPKVHIKPVEEYVNKEYQRRVEEGIKKL